MIKWLSISLLLLLVLSGCWVTRYKTNKGNIKYQYFDSEYKKDTIHIENYVLCSSVRKSRLTKVLAVDRDSLFNMFTHALEQFDFPVKISQHAKPFCDSALYANYYVDLEKIDENKIRQLAKVEQDDKLRMLPVIYIDNMDMAFIGLEIEGKRHTFLNFVIYLFKGDKKIYTKAMFYSAPPAYRDYLDDDYEPEIYITQENWNELMRLVMKEYVERLEE